MRWEWFKNKELGFLMIWSQGTLSVVFSPVNNCFAGKKGRVFFIASWRVMKDGFITATKEKKVMGTAGSCFYVIGSVKYSRCEGYAVYLVGPGRCYFLWAIETERNFYWGTVSNAIDAFEPSTARKTDIIWADARKKLFYSLKTLGLTLPNPLKPTWKR